MPSLSCCPSDPPPPVTGHPGAWADACLVLRMVALDPVGMGVVLRAPCGPVRDIWLAQLRALLPPSVPVRRVPAAISDDRLLGGLDLAATLAAGRPRVERGALAAIDGGLAVLATAERVPPETAARICQAIDASGVAVERDGLALRHPARFGLIALDEGIALDERPPAPLCERAAFWIDLTMLGPRDAAPLAAGDLVLARRRLPE
ncbi:MAG TPA: magnesium chelatase ATPase subunit D, partial [Acetobacteraceae bacterium]|nr:magnesium chelatase ATPase subunit D [Acetobacteraceae bacterium]